MSSINCRRYSRYRLYWRSAVKFSRFCQQHEITKLEQEQPGSTPTVHLIGDSTAELCINDVMAGWDRRSVSSWVPVTLSTTEPSAASTASFYREARLESVLLSIKPGDIVLIQLGHNDGTYNKEERYTSNADYEMLLSEYYIKGVKQRGAVPVIVTPVPMHGFTSTATLGSYAASARKVAETTGTLMIDAHNLALAHYNSLPGTQQEKQAVLDTYYVLNKKGGSDYTHFTKPGAEKMAEIIYGELVRLEVVK